jgi:hypothetical protein
MAQRLVVRDGKEIVIGEFSVGFDRDKLLAASDEWEGSRPYLLSQPAQFEAVPVFQAFVELLQILERAVLSALMPLLWQDGRFVTGVLAEATDADWFGQVGTLDPLGADGSTRFTLTDPPLQMLQGLHLITLQPGVPGFRIDMEALNRQTPPAVV